jgi:hypothetical protein
MNDDIFKALLTAAMAGVRSLRNRSTIDPERMKVIATEVANEAARTFAASGGTEHDWKNMVQAAWWRAAPPDVEVQVKEKPSGR